MPLHSWLMLCFYCRQERTLHFQCLCLRTVERAVSRRKGERGVWTCVEGGNEALEDVGFFPWNWPGLDNVRLAPEGAAG